MIVTSLITMIITTTMIGRVHCANIPMAGLFVEHKSSAFLMSCILGNFDPFAVDKPLSAVNDQSTGQPNAMVNFPSLNDIHDTVHHESNDNETDSNLNKKNLKDVGPSLDIIDFHPHSDKNEQNSSVLSKVKQLLMQPSIDFLDGQLHDGHEHVHDKTNQSINDEQHAAAANLDDYRRWLEEQKETNQLSRFISLQKEVNKFHLSNARNLTEKLNRTIEELRSASKDKSPTKHEL
jgi:hypothetical protein